MAVELVTGNTAPYGIRFTQSNTFSTAAIFLERQNIATDNTVGMKIGTSQTQRIGFLGATPVPQPAQITQAYTTATRALAAYTPNDQSAAYVGEDVAAVLAELNALRVAYENLRVHHENTVAVLNSVINDLRSVGFIRA